MPSPLRKPLLHVAGSDLSLTIVLSIYTAMMGGVFVLESNSGHRDRSHQQKTLSHFERLTLCPAGLGIDLDSRCIAVAAVAMGEMGLDRRHVSLLSDHRMGLQLSTASNDEKTDRWNGSQSLGRLHRLFRRLAQTHFVRIFRLRTPMFWDSRGLFFDHPPDQLASPGRQNLCSQIWRSMTVWPSPVALARCYRHLGNAR
jgi:hypothetical protein